jgi:hypothetical protein
MAEWANEKTLDFIEEYRSIQYCGGRQTKITRIENKEEVPFRS